MIDSALKNFRNFVEKHAVFKQTNNVLTHTTLGEPKRSYIFNNVDQEKFMKLYIELIKLEAGTDLHFVERPTAVTFLFLYFDFDQKKQRRQYKQTHIQGIIKIVNKFVKKHFNVTSFELKSFVTEKPTSTIKNDAYKDGFHIYYPNLPVI